MARGPVHEALRLSWIRLHRQSYWRYYQWKRGLAEPEMAWLPVLCSPDQRSVDVGGNIGLYAHPMLAHSAQCVVFEPLPPLAQHLRRTFRKEGERFRLEEVALSEDHHAAELRMPQGHFGYSTIEPENQLDGKVSTRRVLTFHVHTQCLDDFDLQNVGFVKIDVEGHEGAVLRGARSLLGAQHPALLIEVEERHKTNAVSDVHAFLHAFGYEAFFLLAGVIHPFADFDLERHQNPERPHDAVRNFLYLPAERCAEILPKLQACLAPRRD